MLNVTPTAGDVLEVLQKGYKIKYSRRGFSGLMADVPQGYCVWPWPLGIGLLVGVSSSPRPTAKFSKIRCVSNSVCFCLIFRKHISLNLFPFSFINVPFYWS